MLPKPPNFNETSNSPSNTKFRTMPRTIQYLLMILSMLAITLLYRRGEVSIGGISDIFIGEYGLLKYYFV